MNEMRYLSIMVHDFPMRILNINHHLLVNVSGMLIGYEWEHEKNNSIFMGPSRGFKERLESVKAGATATASGAVAMVPISALDENSGGDPLVICYIAMVAMVAMALIESSMIFPANR